MSSWTTNFEPVGKAELNTCSARGFGGGRGRAGSLGRPGRAGRLGPSCTRQRLHARKVERSPYWQQCQADLEYLSLALSKGGVYRGQLASIARAAHPEARLVAPAPQVPLGVDGDRDHAERFPR